ncbi:MAG: UDP-3-O-(3-hydroxymyristoyl)glucosamine N-acyltransferase [Planctomycetes bacterium]|nr:UDP-3-O-(3-hydroxymyristoyl)glucosamine N-acyltransferase [Planctomycetota bacterium]
MNLKALAKAIDGELTGDGTVEITGAAPLTTAGPAEISFLANPAYAKYVATTRAAAVIVQRGWTGADVPVIRCGDPYAAFRQAMVLLHGFRKAPFRGIDPRASIDPQAVVAQTAAVGPFVTVCAGARVGAGTVLYPGVFVGPDASIGADCTLHPNVVVYDGCTLGDRVTVHANTVVGEDGFGYATVNGVHEKIPQAGRAWIGDDVEIGACCTIDRATIGTTEVGPGSKFSNLVAIGHGSKIGPGNLLVAQVGIAGSTTTGRYCVFGGQAGVAGHLTLGDGVQVGGGGGVTKNIPAGMVVWGMPATAIAEARRQKVMIRQLPKLRDRVAELERLVAQLTEALDAQRNQT